MWKFLNRGSKYVHKMLLLSKPYNSQLAILTYHHMHDVNSLYCQMYFYSQKKIQQDATMYQNFIIPYLYEAQRVSGDIPPIIRSLKLHWQPLVFHTWKVVGCIVGGR